MQSARSKAWFATIAFAAIGIVASVIMPLSTVSIPDALFYAVLVLNTFFSIKLFASITPPNRAQSAIDGALVMLYVALAFAIGQPILFPFAALTLFIAATAKYVLMLGIVPHPDLLKRKLLIDLAGVLMCAAVSFGATYLNQPVTSAWTFAVVFALANVYLLGVKPMYRL